MAELKAEHLEYFRKQLEKFIHFSDEEWAIFSEQAYLKQLRKKDLFVASGKVCNEMCFILSGSFRMYLLKDGLEISNYFCFDGDLLSSYISFLHRQPSNVTIEAMEDSSLICLSYTAMDKLMKDERIVFRMEQFRRVVAEYLISCYEDRVYSFILKNPEERYQELIEKQPDLMQRIPQHYIANFLGITPVSLSRIRKRITSQTKKNKTAYA